MRIAICFSGQARYVEENFQSVKENLIAPFDCDVFCHFWTKCIADSAGREPHLGYQEFDSSRVEELYEPKALTIEDNPDSFIFGLADRFMHETLHCVSPKEFWFERGQTFRVLSQYLSVLKSITLKRDYEELTGINYDYVIRARSDFVFPRPISIEDFPVEGQITLLPGKGDSTPPTPEGPVSDSFAIGTSQDMNLYCDTFNALGLAIDKKIRLTGESFSAVNMQKHGLKIRYSDLANYQSFYNPKKG